MSADVVNYPLSVNPVTLIATKPVLSPSTVPADATKPAKDNSSAPVTVSERRRGALPMGAKSLHSMESTDSSDVGAGSGQPGMQLTSGPTVICEQPAPKRNDSRKSAGKIYLGNIARVLDL
jgi:hypothetical protein